MGPNLKLRQPFIWQDEMMEVRELFRRVDRIRKSGFTGFSTWESPPPSADTLSRNRLRRRRALCSVELSHLNYKEAPFESLNHLQNIRGMCTRIQRQDYPMERKKKDVDLISRPPLLRRPMSSTSVEKRGRKRLPFEVGRPYSAPTLPMKSISNESIRDLGPIPLQYAAPKLTTLYDITQKLRSTSSNSIHKSFNVLPSVFDQCPSITSSKICIANDCPVPCCALASEQNLIKTSKSVVDTETYGQVGLSSSSKMFTSKDQHSFLRPIKSFKNNTNITPEPSTNDINCCMSQMSNLESNEKINSFAYCGWSTNDETTTSSNMYSTSILNYKSQTSDLSSSLQDTYVTSDFEDIEREKPSFIQSISGYCNVLNDKTKNCFGSKNNTKHSFLLATPTSSKSVFNNSKASTNDESLHEALSNLSLDVSHIESDEGNPSKMRGGRNETCSLYNMNSGNNNIKNNLLKNQTSLNAIKNFVEKQSSNHDIAPNSISNCTHSILDENLEFFGQTSTLTTESRWLTATLQKSLHKNALHLELEKIGNNSLTYKNDEIEQLIGQDTTTTAADDPNVLIKHSSDPYSDFYLSMITMIEEEGLQDRQGELEELFQYYVDLNPKVHHDVLHKVIQNIRTNYLLKTSFKKN